MKKFITAAVLLIGTSLAGILTWRKVEADRIRNDLWTEAENAFDKQDAEAHKVPVSRS
ncbi:MULTISPECIES: DLW-39 family protein [unclassified Brachybacterium]|uniref:DLW-39 family protein n=1 Tax=unclassified Brachybacterium TaxID=2623841 RepID=UPI0018ECCCFA|nr:MULTISPECIES: DLW-39 family protein [unclassified Brachybacterium]